MERITNKTLEEMVTQINERLADLGSPKRVERRGAYGLVGLSALGQGHDHTPLMTKRELANYLRGVLDGLYQFS